MNDARYLAVRAVLVAFTPSQLVRILAVPLGGLVCDEWAYDAGSGRY